MTRNEYQKTDSSSNQNATFDLAMEEGGIPAMRVAFGDNGCYAFLCTVSGNAVCAWYEEFGPALFSKSIRCFQHRGSIRRGIERTIRDAPERFLALNGGIVLTAKDSETTQDGPFAVRLKKLIGFHVADGVQTIGSLYFAHKKYKLDLSKVSVSVKILVGEMLVRSCVSFDVSLAHNSHLLVSIHDRFGCSVFENTLETISRVELSPLTSTGWFLERKSGQYREHEEFQSTANGSQGRIAFRNRFPPRQVFAFGEAAEVSLSWDGDTAWAVRGHYHSCRRFLEKIPEDVAASREFFHKLIAKIIIFRALREIVEECSFGYRTSLALTCLGYLNRSCDCTFDLNRIWDEQRVSDELSDILTAIVNSVWCYIKEDTKPSRYLTTWFKSEDKQSALMRIPLEPSVRSSLRPFLIP